MNAFAAAAAAIAADVHMGVEAVWREAGQGPGLPLRVVPSRPEDAIGGLEGPRAIAAAAVVMVPASALPARPARGDALTFHGTHYVVAEVLADEIAASFTLHLRRA